MSDELVAVGGLVLFCVFIGLIESQLDIKSTSLWYIQIGDLLFQYIR